MLPSATTTTTDDNTAASTFIASTVDVEPALVHEYKGEAGDEFAMLSQALMSSALNTEVIIIDFT